MHWENIGINHVKDILNEKCEFLNPEELNHQNSMNKHFVLTSQIQASIPKTWKKNHFSQTIYQSATIVTVQMIYHTF